MDFKGSFFSSRPFIVTFIGALAIIVLFVIGGTALLVRNTWLNMRISSICPDYFSYEYAWVVDENGRGLDSVAVTMRDNSNVNLIYRVFTDSTGRFVLFHDFGSFALHEIPFSYFLYVSAEGWSDTVRYRFKRYRGCHFRKTDGPDTIVFNPAYRSVSGFRMEKTGRVLIDSGYAFAPYEDIALSRRRPEFISGALPGDSVYYTMLKAGKTSVGFAVLPVSSYRIDKKTKTLMTEGVWYCIDRDHDGDLSEETPVEFSGTGECTVAGCRAVDSVSGSFGWYFFDLRLRRTPGKAPRLRYRRADALQGTVTVDSVGYPVLLWDYGGSDYSDLSTVILSVDRNRDGAFAAEEGNRELYEQCRGRIAFDSVTMRIDTIAPDGSRLFCSAIRHTREQSSEATVGTWVDNFTAAATCPLSLYQECAVNRYVLLYFFEGAAGHFMEAPEVSLLVALMRDRLGATRIIGVNRRSAGEPYITEPVINENLGWDGPLVRQFHNHRDREIICLDAQGTIVYRGVPGTGAITGIWHRAGVDPVVAQAVYEQRLSGLVVDAVPE